MFVDGPLRPKRLKEGLLRQFARIASMAFDPSQFSAEVQSILALDGNGERRMPLAEGSPLEAGRRALAGRNARELFPGSASPDAALSGLYLYFCAYDESHRISQDIHTPEGSFWHGILHRQEPDPDNARYWFRRVGEHPTYPALRRAAADAGFEGHDRWDPFAFIDFCETARRKPGSTDEEIALTIQSAEWQLLFSYCARRAK